MVDRFCCGAEGCGGKQQRRWSACGGEGRQQRASGFHIAQSQSAFAGVQRGFAVEQSAAQRHRAGGGRGTGGTEEFASTR